MNESVAGGRFVSWVAFAFGSVMSIAANVLHTWLPPTRPADAPVDWVAPADWAPSVASQLGAGVWPVALLLSVEVLSRVQWPDAWLWNLARYGGVGAVGVCSAIISYGHVYGVLMAWGYGELGSAVGPFVLDGLMVVSGFALLAPAVSASSARPETAADEAADPDQQEGTPANDTEQDPVADLIAAGVGRRRLAKELEISEYEARQILAQRTNGHGGEQ